MRVQYGLDGAVSAEELASGGGGGGGDPGGGSAGVTTFPSADRTSKAKPLVTFTNGLISSQPVFTLITAVKSVGPPK
jgi:hypothetical protein